MAQNKVLPVGFRRFESKQVTVPADALEGELSFSRLRISEYLIATNFGGEDVYLSTVPNGEKLRIPANAGVPMQRNLPIKASTVYYEADGATEFEIIGFQE